MIVDKKIFTRAIGCRITGFTENVEGFNIVLDSGDAIKIKELSVGLFCLSCEEQNREKE